MTASVGGPTYRANSDTTEWNLCIYCLLPLDHTAVVLKTRGPKSLLAMEFEGQSTLEIRGGNDERLARFAASAMSCRNLLLWHGTGVRMHDLHHLAS